MSVLHILSKKSALVQVYMMLMTVSGQRHHNVGDSVRAETPQCR